LLEAVLQIVPRNETILTLAALILSLITAEENVTFDIVWHAQIMSCLF
jgi:hypothetical protein